MSNVIAQENELDLANENQWKVNSLQSVVTNMEIIMAVDLVAQHEA